MASRAKEKLPAICPHCKVFDNKTVVDKAKLQVESCRNLLKISLNLWMLQSGKAVVGKFDINNSF